MPVAPDPELAVRSATKASEIAAGTKESEVFSPQRAELRRLGNAALLFGIALVVAWVGITRLTNTPDPNPGISDDSGALIPTVLMLVAIGVAGVSVRKIWKSARRLIHRDWRTHPAQNKGDRSS